MVNRVSLVKSDVITDSWIETSLCESEAYFICSISASVANVYELCNEGKLMLLYISIRDNGRRKVRQRRHLICRCKILTISRIVQAHDDKYQRGKSYVRIYISW